MNDKPIDHLTGSGQGKSECNDDAALLRDLAALPRAIRPAHDPWQQISQRIAVEQSRQLKDSGHGLSRTGWLALAASVTLVAVSAVFMMQSPATREPAHQPIARQDRQQPAAGEIIAPLPTSPVELEYQAAFREFARVDMSQAPVSDQAKNAISQDWALMRQLEQDLLVALEQNPENPLLLDRWAQLRASQLQLLHVIAETGQLPGRTLI
ncbi:MAG TPA: hypothetical protein VFG52_02950 [Xanthomonadales bacterium]|nr:hypothetical protein [Xanthomonadales bacterium]